MGFLDWLGLGTTSKTTVDVLTDTSTRVTADSILSCTNVANQEQMLSFHKITGNVTIQNVTLSQGIAVDLKCVMDATKQAEIANKVAEAIAQEAESRGEAVLSLFGRTKSEASSNISTQIKNGVTANTTTEFETTVGQTQKITVANVEGNVVMNNVTAVQGATYVASALMKTSMFSNVLIDSANKIDSKSKTEEKNPIAEIIKSIFQAPILLLGGILLGIILVIVGLKFMFSSTSASSPSSPFNFSSLKNEV